MMGTGIPCDSDPALIGGYTYVCARSVGGTLDGIVVGMSGDGALTAYA